MKQTITITIALIISFLSLQAQDCEKLLEGGLYSFTSMTNTGSFNKDLRTYYLSEQFKSDMRSGKWGSSLTIPVNGVPISIEMDDSEDKFIELRTKLLEVNELNISETFYQTTYSSIPNTNLYEKYVECRKIPVGQTGFVQGLNIETEETVVFTIFYRPQSPGDSMPIVKNFNVTPTNSIISGNLKEGDKLNGYSILVTCKRHEEKDLVLTLETDRGAFSSKAAAMDNIASGKELPIGTIITSFLNFEQFNIAAKNNEKSPGGIWSSLKSKWSPCDGRPVPNSKFQKLTSQNSLPDLRGMFVRGLNQFDPYQPVPTIANSKADPDNRVVGSFQTDEIKDHKHEVSYQRGRTNSSNGGGHNHEVTDGETTASAATHKCNECKSETRPKNVAVFYYIKIN